MGSPLSTSLRALPGPFSVRKIYTFFGTPIHSIFGSRVIPGPVKKSSRTIPGSVKKSSRKCIRQTQASLFRGVGIPKQPRRSSPENAPTPKLIRRTTTTTTKKKKKKNPMLRTIAVPLTRFIPIIWTVMRQTCSAITTAAAIGVSVR